MNCPICGEKSKVIDCKADCESVQRKRKCTVCANIFYTEEYEVDSGDRFRELKAQAMNEYNAKRRRLLKEKEPVQLQIEFPEDEQSI